MIELWSINRWLRWTGFRLFIDVDEHGARPTLIGFRWVGLYGSRGWRALEPAPARDLELRWCIHGREVSKDEFRTWALDHPDWIQAHPAEARDLGLESMTQTLTDSELRG